MFTPPLAALLCQSAAMYALLLWQGTISSHTYYHYEERGWITLHGLENVNAMYKEYHALGGNGTVTSLVNSIRELDVRDDKRPASQE